MTYQKQWVEHGRYAFKKLSVNIKTEIVRQAFSEKGLIVNSDWYYINNSSLIPYVCSKGHKHAISYANFAKGVGCVYCSKRPPKTSKSVQLEFEQAGLIIQKDWNYQSANTLIPFTCSSGHKHALTYNKFQQGQRCLYCVGTPKHSLEHVRNTFFSHGLLIPPNWVYINSNTPIPFTCTKGHNYQLTYQNVKNGQNCIYCYSESQCSKTEIDFSPL